MNRTTLTGFKLGLGFLLSVPVLLLVINIVLSNREDRQLLGDIYSRQMQNLHYSIN